MATSPPNEARVSLRTSPRRCVLLWLGVGLVLAIRGVQLREFIIDDAFISFRYARNFVEGEGLVFNPGERVEGYSNLLWILAVSPFVRAGFDPMLAARLLSVICVCLTFLLLLRLSAELNGAVDEQAALCALGLSLNSSFVLWMLGGLETQLMALCVTGLLWAVWHERDRPVPVLSVVLSAGIVFVRPEGVAYAAAAGFALFAARVVSGRRTGVAWACPIAAGLVAFGGYTLWRLWYYGSALPNVFYAKSGGTFLQAGEGARYVCSFVSAYGHLVFFALPLVTWLTRPKARPLLLAAAALTAAGVSFAVYAGGDWMPGHRFLVPLMPLAYLLLQEGARDVLRVMGSGGAAQLAPVAGIVGWTLFLAAHCAHFPWAQERAHSFGTEHELARAAGEFLARRARPGAVLAVADAGALPYFSRLKTVDRRGLMDKHIARLPRSDFMWKCDEPYVLAAKPDYIESQLHINAGLRPLASADEGNEGIPAHLQQHLRQLPSGKSLGVYVRQSRWVGDLQLYTTPDFLDNYRPLLVYKVPNLWYVAICERKMGTDGIFGGPHGM